MKFSIVIFVIIHFSFINWLRFLHSYISWFVINILIKKFDNSIFIMVSVVWHLGTIISMLSELSGLCGFCTNYGWLWRFCTCCGELWKVISKLYTAVYILKFTMHLCIYGSLYSPVASAGESTQCLLMRMFSPTWSLHPRENFSSDVHTSRYNSSPSLVCHLLLNSFPNLIPHPHCRPSLFQ